METKDAELADLVTCDNSHGPTLASPQASQEALGQEGSEDVNVDWTKERYQWTTKREYMLSVIGYSVGLGNIWRFPYMCQRNGGGAFLIPFVMCLVLCGLPLFVLEAALGQFTGRSTLHVWSVCPLLKGAGLGTVVINAILAWYYSPIMAWALYYLVNSFRSTLPWSRCDGWWNTPQCSTPARETNASLFVAANRSLADDRLSMEWSNATDVFDKLFLNATETGALNSTKQISASEEFWQNNVLQVSSGLGEIGHVVWYLAIGLGVTVLSCFLGLIRGIKSSGKVVYVTATLPYVLLTVLLVRGVTLPGSMDGIMYYLRPDFRRLLDPTVWVEAALQVFYSLGPGWGAVITMSSYNKFHNNFLRDSIFLTFLCEGTSVYGGFAIFAVLGYMAHEAGVTVDKVVSSGPGLAFIVYPEAISMMPLPQLWAVLFFIMIITVFLDSQFTDMEIILTALCDYFPRQLMRHRTLLTALYCVVIFLTALCFVTQGGVYVFQLVDWFIATLTVTTISLMECLVLGWIYGADRFSEDIQMMIGRKLPVFIRLLWCFATPFLMAVLFVFTLMRYKPPTYGDYHYDVWGSVLGWIVAAVSFVPIPAVVVYKLYRAKGTLLQRLRQTTTPDKGWGPADVTKRRLYQKEVLQRQPRSGWTDVIRR